MSSITEQIKDRLPVVEVLSSYMKLEQSGKNFKARCPFHNEKTPSFFVSPERGSYYCFGCGAKGDIFSFVEGYEGVDFLGAVRILAERAGVSPGDAQSERTEKYSRLYALLEEATAFFERKLETETVAREYYKKRGLQQKTVGLFRLGYAEALWHGLHEQLRKKGFTDEEIYTVGLLKKKQEGNAIPSYYDTFRGRLMFPIADPSGRIIAFSGRLPGKEDAYNPKYLNSPETPFFRKSEVLYGFDKAKTSIRKYNFTILVEGPVDVLLAHQVGFTNTVAVMGTSCTRAHIERLKKISQNLIIALDSDPAGMSSAKKTARLAIAQGMDVKLAPLPKGKDPADVITENIDVWRAAIRNASHIIDFLLADVKETHGNDERKFKQQVRSQVLPYVGIIPNKIDQSHFIGKLGEVIGVDENYLREELIKVAYADTQEGAPLLQKKETILIDRRDTILKHLVGIILWQKYLGTNTVTYNEMEEKLTTLLESPLDVLFSADEQQAFAFEAEIAYAGSGSLSRHIDEMFLYLEEEIVKERFEKVMKTLVQAERAGDTEAAQRILEECKSLVERLNTLKNKIKTELNM